MILWYCGIVLYGWFDRAAVDGFLTKSNNTHVRDCLDPTAVIKTKMMIVMMMMMMMLMMMMVMVMIIHI